MDIAEYLEWRRGFMANPVGQELNSSRGKCIVGRDLTIDALVRHGWHMQNRELEDAEFNLIFHGQDMSPEWRKRLYENDDILYDAYKSLHIDQFLKCERRTSRKNIIFNRECCLCYWQLRGNNLTVISRSWDIQRAGLSDLIIVNRIAGELGCKSFTIITLNNHIYENRDVIARRQDANPGI